MPDGIDAPVNATELSTRGPILNCSSPHCKAQELLAANEAVLGLGKLSNPVVNGTRRRFSMPDLGNRRFVNHARRWSRSATHAWRAETRAFATQKRLQPAGTASGFDPLK
jgi:hypothetical protein